MLAMRTILHPTDFSDYSDHAFRLACSLAHDYGARLVVLHVAELPVMVGGEGVLVLPRAVDLEPLREQLAQIEPEDPRVDVERQIVVGEAAAEILRVAAEIKCDLIIMGTHGRRGLRRLVMGSVAEKVVRTAPCPVLTVKTPHSLELASEELIAATSGDHAELATIQCTHKA
jgi:nucleotide-binding universal stress UspA family protein